MLIEKKQPLGLKPSPKTQIDHYGTSSYGKKELAPWTFAAKKLCHKLALKPTLWRFLKITSIYSCAMR